MTHSLLIALLVCLVASRVYAQSGGTTEAALRRAALEAPPNSAAHAQALGALGEFYDEFGRFSDAEACLLKALEAWRKVLGPRHPALVRVVNRLAFLYLETGEWKKARRLDLPSWLAMVDSPTDRIHLLENQAALETMSNHFEESQKTYQSLLELTPPQSIERATALNNLGLAYLRARRYDLAIESLTAALEIFDQDFNIAMTAHSLAIAYLKAGQIDRVEPHLGRSLRAAKTAFGSRSPRTASILETYAQFLRQQNRRAEAKEMEDQARLILTAAHSVVDIGQLALRPIR